MMPVKLMFKLMIVILVLLVASPFMLPGKNGQRLFSLSDLKMPDFSSLFGSRKSNIMVIPENSTPEKEMTQQKKLTTVHKWIDEYGVWQFSDQNNSGGDGEVLKINPDINVVKAMEVAKPEEENEENSTQDDAESSLPGISLTTVPVDKIPKLINDTKNLKSTLDKRYEEQQTLLDSLTPPTK